MKKYPLFGLAEVGNLSVHHPVNATLNRAIGEGAILTYLQLYTPFVKPLELNLKECPYLITYLLSIEYVRRNPRFERIKQLVEMADKLLLECIEKQLYRSSARLELVYCSRRASSLFSLEIHQITSYILRQQAMIEVSELKLY